MVKLIIKMENFSTKKSPMKIKIKLKSVVMKT